MRDRAAEEGIQSAEDTKTPYVNTIPVKDQAAFPGNREIERRIKSIVRWNAMAMVVRATNRGGGVGGHISTFASSATLYEIGYNHFFKVVVRMVTQATQSISRVTRHPECTVELF